MIKSATVALDYLATRELQVVSEGNVGFGVLQK